MTDYRATHDQALDVAAYLYIGLNTDCYEPTLVASSIIAKAMCHDIEGSEQAYMNTTIQSILNNLSSENHDIAQNAFTDVALLFEKHSDIQDLDQHYQLLLSSSIHNLRLTDEDQQYIIQHIEQMIRSGTIQSSMFWALGKARRDLIFDKLLSFTSIHQNHFDIESFYELGLAIDKLLIIADGHEDLSRQLEYINKYHLNDFTYFLENSEDPRLNQISQWINEKLALSYLYDANTKKFSLLG